MAHNTINPFEPACGCCRYMDQRHSGTHRFCSRLKTLVPAFSKPCARFEDIWEKDIFGVTVYEYMKQKGLAI